MCGPGSGDAPGGDPTAAPEGVGTSMSGMDSGVSPAPEQGPGMNAEHFAPAPAFTPPATPIAQAFATPWAPGYSGSDAPKPDLFNGYYAGGYAPSVSTPSPFGTTNNSSLFVK